MEDVILILIILAVASAAAYYIYKAKKRGQKCIGCPHAKQCSGRCHSEK